ncbi:ferredoxin-type protein NapF [Rhodobacter sp. NSM]|uniref:ferredoxin-type protein NapF n=1 Tax=Rhodobacter sp. NSM TaxID=3457501 RepID=UPI003FD42B26
MPSTATRRALLTGHLSEMPHPRPPGAVATQAFADDCTGCGDCARACPQGIILRDREGLPVVDMRAGACTFCRDCTRACPTGALAPAEPWNWRAEVGAGCLDMAGIPCRACEDFCDRAAIRFRPQLGGRARPIIDPETCTGCGACIAPCPEQVIHLTRKEICRC